MTLVRKSLKMIKNFKETFPGHEPKILICSENGLFKMIEEIKDAKKDFDGVNYEYKTENGKPIRILPTIENLTIMGLKIKAIKDYPKDFISVSKKEN